MADDTPRSHRRPGRMPSLYDLYDLVPASEEIDLAEQAARDRVAAQIQGHLDELWLQTFGVGPDDGVFDTVRAAPEQVDEVEPSDRLSDGQVRGMLEHILGARPIREGDAEG